MFQKKEALPIYPTMTSTVGGLVPTPPNNATKYLDGTGNWSTPPGVSSYSGFGSDVIDMIADPVYGLTANGEAADYATDNDALVQAALATGRNIYIPLVKPDGTFYRYLIHTPIYPKTGQTIMMPQSVNIINAGLFWQNTTDFCFNQNASYSTLVNVLVNQHSSYSPTAGGHFSKGHATTQVTTPYSFYCTSYGAYNAFYDFGKVAGNYEDGNLARGAINNGRLTDLASGYGLGTVRSFGAGGFSSSSPVGWLIDGCDTTTIGLVNLTGFIQSFHFRANSVNSGGLSISRMQCENQYSSSPFNVIAIGDGSHTVKDLNIENLELYSTNQTNVYVGTNSTKTILNAIQMRAAASGNFTDDGVETSVFGGQIKGSATLSGTKPYMIGLRGITTLTVNSGATHHKLALLSPSSTITIDAGAKATGSGYGITGVADWKNE